MENKIQEYKERLEKEILDSITGPMTIVTLRSAESIGRVWLLYDDIWCRLHSYKDHKKAQYTSSERLTEEEIKEWNSTMVNSDGTMGGHWTVEQTAELANSLKVCFEHITPEEWNVTCNMVYSDYSLVMRKLGQDNASAYGHLAKAFLFDMDGGEPEKKLCRYYNYVVKAAK